MTPKERGAYFGELWPAACAACDWAPKDDAKRREITRICMREIGAVETDSTSRLGRDEVTALFTFLAHLGDPASLDKSARWDTCKRDYKTFARAKQADWHERQLYGAGKNKLDRNRFAGATSASGGPLDELDPDEVHKRHLTMASRHQAKQRRERAELKSATPAPAPEPALVDESAPF